MITYCFIILLLSNIAGACDEGNKPSCKWRDSCGDYEYPSGNTCHGYAKVECCKVRDAAYVILWIIAVFALLIVLTLVYCLCGKKGEKKSIYEMNRIYATLFKMFEDDIRAKVLGNRLNGEWKILKTDDIVSVDGNIATVGVNSATIRVDDYCENFILPGPPAYRLSTATDIENEDAILWHKVNGEQSTIQWERVNNKIGAEMTPMETSPDESKMEE